MLTFLISTAVLSGLVQGDAYAVAFSARYYNPPGSNAVSHSQLYTCSLDGSQRHCWAITKGDVREVWWKSHGVLSYRVEGADPKALTNIMEEWELDLTTKQRHRVAKGLTAGYRHAQRSLPREGPMPQTDALTSLKKLGHLVSISTDQTEIVVDGKAPIVLDNRIHSLYVDGKADRFWIFTYDHDSTTGANFGAYLMNWKKNRVDLKMNQARSADFRISSPTYAMVSVRDTVPHGKNRTVWISQAIVGDWMTGKRTLIAGPKTLDESNHTQPFPVIAKHPDQSYQFSIALRP